MTNKKPHANKERSNSFIHDRNHRYRHNRSINRYLFKPIDSPSVTDGVSTSAQQFDEDMQQLAKKIQEEYLATINEQSF